MAAGNDARGFQGKLPPQNLEAEMGVLGSILLMHEAIDEVGDVLRPDHFYADRHQKIFGAVLGLYENGKRGIDAVTLAEELDRRNQLDEIGGVEYLSKILEAVPNAAHAKYYAKIVRDRWIQRSLAYACTEILEECYTGRRETEDILETAEQQVFRILEQQEKAEHLTIKDILDDAFQRIEARKGLGGGIAGLTSGFIDLDAQLNGFQGSELIILAARPSMGKTALVCNIAEAVADANKGCLIFSLEMSKLELAERLLCIRAKVNGHDLRAGTLDDVAYEALINASSELSRMPMFLDDQPGRTIGQISAVSRRVQRRFGLNIIIIDYLQLIEPEDRMAPRTADRANHPEVEGPFERAKRSCDCSRAAQPRRGNARRQTAEAGRFARKRCNRARRRRGDVSAPSGRLRSRGSTWRGRSHRGEKPQWPNWVRDVVVAQRIDAIWQPRPYQ